MLYNISIIKTLAMTTFLDGFKVYDRESKLDCVGSNPVEVDA
jgi:hypothetical protein